ncbi:MAG: site-specific DNA-methyltransferase [Ignavibacterium sp.]|nr:site-specific DNA-methyltransferase [Ignavibacterium sp.]MDW8376461.1 DNA methyltransferase [Ignavibacteriales bacterium]
MQDLFSTIDNDEFLTIKKASQWASKYLGRIVTPSNISYLIQYGKIRKIGDNGNIFVSKKELINYYNSYNGKREISWKYKLGEDLNWALSFEQYKESETTKHVHRLHPYKGKFIPQLVEYFLDSHTDNFKKEIFFREGDIILDPFCGSGTTLVQANELKINAIGVDVSEFNTLISNCKINKFDLFDVKKEIDYITIELKKYLIDSKTVNFEEELSQLLNVFNNEYFPSPEYKYKLKFGEIDEEQYSKEKEQEFLIKYYELIKKYKINLKQNSSNSFLDKWYLHPVREEINFVFDLVKKIKNTDTQKIVSLILSRTIRSCRATTHSDLATLKEPVTTTYYCTKHAKICKPLFSILKWWQTYSKDTIKRLSQFDKIRTNTHQICLTGDSRTIDLITELEKKHPALAKLVTSQKIRGIFSSPPYVGLIDYHEQHAYAYDLFGFKRKDDLEIGPLFRGQGKEARYSYVEGISQVLLNCKKYLVKDYNVFLVANDKYNLYPEIAKRSGMIIVNQFKRPVLNRTEKDKGAYSEIIFHLKEK